MLLINNSNCEQILRNPGCIFPLIIYPKMAFNPDVISGFKFHFLFEEFDIEMFRNKESVAFFRSFALGDILLLIPVVRWLKKEYNIKNVSIITKLDICKFLRVGFKDIGFYTEEHYMHMQNTLCFNFDSILEKDHNPGNPESTKHRIDIYFESIGIKSYNKHDLNWKPFYLPKDINVNMTTERKKIGLQIRGSTDIKKLPHCVVERIAKELSEKYSVYLIHGSTDLGFDGPNIINTCGKLNVIECIALLTKLDCCITMDSGVLWMAHAANCPVLTILGPTRESERLTLHPQYPQKAKAINIAEEIIGCKPCFETKQYCKGAINCMRNFDHDTLLKLIKIKLNEILGD